MLIILDKSTKREYISPAETVLISIVAKLSGVSQVYLAHDSGED